MLNPFPSLLSDFPLAEALLRIAAAWTFLYMAWAVFHTRKKIENTSLPIIGNPPDWLVLLSAALTALIGAALLVGWETQYASIVGMIIALKHGVFARKYHAVIPLSRGTYIILFVICLSLLITGAGAFAMDVPL